MADLERQARHLAIRVVCKLDPFIAQCFDVVHDRGVQDIDCHIVPQVKPPALFFPDDVNWESLDANLACRTLGFPNTVEMIEQWAAFTGEVVAHPPGHEEHLEARVTGYAGLGLEAVPLTNEIRHICDIPVPAHREIDAEKAFKTAMVEMEKRDNACPTSRAEPAKQIATPNDGDMPKAADSGPNAVDSDDLPEQKVEAS